MVLLVSFMHPKRHIQLLLYLLASIFLDFVTCYLNLNSKTVSRVLLNGTSDFFRNTRDVSAIFILRLDNKTLADADMSHRRGDTKELGKIFTFVVDKDGIRHNTTIMSSGITASDAVFTASTADSK